jgi:hypothetical protein
VSGLDLKEITMTAHSVSVPASTSDQACDPARQVTRSLLGYGLFAGPTYVVVSLAQALTRDGFDLTSHPWSVLANGSYGWIQVTNLLVTGLMVILFAVGLRRALASGPGALWAPRLLAVYGLGLAAAGVFRADPTDGFPVGSPPGPGVVSWHGMLHMAFAGVGFACLTAACLVLARRYASERRTGWAWFSRVVGVAFLTGFAMLASGGGSPASIITFIGAVILVSGWMTAVSFDRYRHPAVTHTTAAIQ